MPEGESERTVASCLDCGTAYAARTWIDGTIKPIGRSDGCRCGSTEFRTVDASTTRVSGAKNGD